MSEREIRLLSPEKAKTIYRRDIARDFPPDERKPWASIERLMRADRYVCLGFYEAAGLRGYGFFATLPAENGGLHYLLDYFAILPAYRKQGLGAAFLPAMLARLPDAASVIGEAENPACAANEADRALRERRIRFYLRCGVRDTGGPPASGAWNTASCFSAGGRFRRMRSAACTGPSTARFSRPRCMRKKCASTDED